MGQITQIILLLPNIIIPVRVEASDTVAVATRIVNSMRRKEDPKNIDDSAELKVIKEDLEEEGKEHGDEEALEDWDGDEGVVAGEMEDSRDGGHGDDISEDGEETADGQPGKEDIMLLVLLQFIMAFVNSLISAFFLSSFLFCL